MQHRLTRILTRLRTSMTRRGWLLALGVATFVGLVVWMLPRPFGRVITVDQSDSWQEDEGPLRRQIIWKQAQSLDVPAADSLDFVTPSWTDAGGTLYFALRSDNGDADIVRSRFVDGQWTDPELIAEISTESDELGPVIDRSGRTMYFYSNRPGGRGGFDLYVSHRSKQGWSEPANLGPSINTPAHEYDPAVSPDQLTLVFSSNRVPTESKEDESPSTWSTTLRARQGLLTFDLYRASRESIDGQWGAVEPIIELNRPDSHEGAPYISPDGAFLYFASDRPVKGDQEPNLDLYRARLDGERFLDPQNLGTSINTAAHETEPALSPEGFTIVFSSDRDGRNRLYSSSATEVYEEQGWSTAHVGSAWRPLALAVLLATLIGLLIASWYARSWLYDRLWPARFFIGSMLINLLLILVLAIWKLPAVTQILSASFTEPVEAAELLNQTGNPSEGQSREAFERVNDLDSIEPVSMAALEPSRNVPRSATESIETFRRTFTNDSARPMTLNQAKTTDLNDSKSAQAAPTLFQRQRADGKADVRELAEELEELKTASSIEPPESRIETNTTLVREDFKTISPAEFRRNLPALVESQPDLSLPEQSTDEPPARSRSENSPLSRAEFQPGAIKSLEHEQDALPELPAATVQALSPVDDIDLKVAKTEHMFTETVFERFNSNRSSSSVSPHRLENRSSDELTLPDDKNGNSEGQPPALAKSLTADPAVISDSADEELPALPKVDQDLDFIPADEFDIVLERAERLSSQGVEPSLERKPFDLAAKIPHSDSIDDSSPSDRPLPLSDLSRRNPLARRSAGPDVATAPDRAVISAMFTLRQGRTRKEFIELFGGTEESEDAVELGLRWLADHQNADGSWSLHRHPVDADGKTIPSKKYNGLGSERSDSAATGLALLPFLAAGHTHQEGDYQKVVDAGLKWLLAHQNEKGDLFGPNDRQRMYSHGIATIALCEAYGMTQDAELKQPAVRALEYIEKAQHRGSGGWRYNPNERGDTSVVGWQMMALKSGEMAGLAIPPQVLDGVRKWLKSVEGNQPVGGHFGYTNRGSTPAMTAEALLCVQFLGDTPRDDSRMRAGADLLLRHLPEKKQTTTSYYWYYATQVMYHMQGEDWAEWNSPLRELLMSTQLSDGPLAGTWNPQDQWEKRAGRLYATSLRLLMLEVYYRHLPLFDQLTD